jgi:biotin operon repressor
MKKTRTKGENIRKFVLDHIDKHPNDINSVAAKHFGITRQAINKHLQNLVAEQTLIESGNTKSKVYKLAPLLEWRQAYNIGSKLAEDVVWRNDIQPVLGKVLDNVLGIWHWGFTEMFNNAIDHSGGSEIVVQIKKTAINTEMLIVDNGIGIFKKIQTAKHLLDERHAILELAKGKLTTDPKNHSGQGIFFTSRMFDAYGILSGDVFFSHQFSEPEDWILKNDQFSSGTLIWMKLHNHTARTAKKIFDQYTSGDDLGFTKTVVPVKLAQYGKDELISRSQAKRLLARVELFKTVIFDFTGIDFIGQAFADEIFRVFVSQHPKIEIIPMHAKSEVMHMIKSARSGLKS